MHIGFLTPEYVMPGQIDGGLANYIKKTSHSLALRGNQVTVFVLSERNKTWNDGLVNISEVKRTQIPRWLKGKQYHSFLNQILSSQNLKREVWKKHRSSPLDILQASSYLTPGFSLLNNGKVPLICRISSYTPLCRAAQGKEHRFGDYLNDWLELHQIRDADAAFAPSDLIAKALIRLENLPISVIRTPLDNMDELWNADYYNNNFSGKKYFLYFGTLNRIKGVDLLAEVLPQLLYHFKDLNFLFIGRDNSKINSLSYFDYICSKCLGCDDQLQYHSALPKSQLYPILAHAIGVIIPSRVDNYPNVCLEALSLGVPVVGTSDSSLEEMIIDGETGFLAENANPKSIYDAILRLLSLSANERDKMRTNIKTSIEVIKGEDRIANLMAFYEQTIQNYKLKAKE
jgi:glycosyltransferase involved in cell wall biosynthesis